ncbi:MAG: hypothetical protein LBE12_09890 [Planctomycetaceae bacterium]|nr:hypothetical protein [Planctomycetaceae bacterium]
MNNIAYGIITVWVIIRLRAIHDLLITINCSVVLSGHRKNIISPYGNDNKNKQLRNNPLHCGGLLYFTR